MRGRDGSQRLQWLKDRVQRYWLPLVLVVVATIAVLGLWHQLVIEEHRHIEQLVQQQVNLVQTELEKDLTAHVSTLERMAKRWDVAGGTSKNVWETSAASNIEDFPGLQAIAWVDSSFQVQWSVPQDAINLFQDLNLRQESYFQAILNEARNLRQPRLTPAILFPNGEKGFLAVAPLFVEAQADGSGRDRFDGFLLGFFPSRTLFDSILPSASQYQVQISDNTGLVYQQGEILPSALAKMILLQAYGREWQVQVALTSLIHEERSLLPALILWGGLAGAWIIALAVYQRQRSERFARQSRKINQQLQQEIVERQQIELELRRSEASIRNLSARLELAVESAQIGIWDWDIIGDRLIWNDQMYKLYGLNPSDFSGVYEAWATALHPDDFELATTAIQQAIEGEGEYEPEFRVIHPDGTIRFIKAHSIVQRDAQGQAQRMIGANFDITERKQSELVLKESEAKYRQLVNHINMGFVVHAPDTHILQCNETACELLGLSMEQMLGKEAIDPAWHFLREDGTVMPVEEYPVNRVLSTQVPLENYVLGIYRGTQSQTWVLLTAFPEFDINNHLKQIVVTFIDISQLKRAETELREMTEVMENAISGISKLDTQGRYLYVNKVYADMTGYRPEEMIGMLWYQTVHPDDLAPLNTAYQQMRQDGKVEVEARGVRQDGSSFYKQLVMISAYDEQQQFIGHYCFMKDISDRKQAEEALEKELLRSKTFLNTSIDGIVVLNDEGNVLQTSPSFAHMIGYSVEETLNLHVADWNAQWTREELLHQMGENGAVPPVFETRHRRKDGSLYAVEIGYSRATLDDEVMHFCICRDISDRKRIEAERQRMENALRESESRFQTFMNHSPASAWVTDANGIMLYANHTYFKTFQLPTLDVIGKSIFELYPTGVAQQFLANIQTVAQTLETLETVEFAPRLDGVLGDFLVYKFPVPDESGQILVGGMAIDITQQYRAEEALRQSEATKQAIIQAIPDLLVRMKSDGSYLEFISNSHFNITNPDQIRRDATVHDVLPAHLAQLRMHHIQRALEFNTVQIYEQEIVIKGEQRYEEVRIVALLQNEALIMVRDITDRKRAEEELRHQKEMFQVIVDNIPVMVALFNDQGRIDFINPELERTLGWSLEEWQQRDVMVDLYPDPIYLQSVLDHMTAAMGNWKDFTTLTASKQQIETSWTNVPISKGRFLGIGQDVSERAQRDAERKRKEIALQQAMEAAEAANLAKSMFLANMSHELRTPLNVILGFSQVMSRDSSLTPGQLDDLQTIRRSGDYLLSLINDILDLSKIEAGHCTLEESGFDLISLLHTLRSMMAERAQAKRLQLTFDIAPKVPQFVFADEQKLRQVLLNLLSNAIKFTKQGSVILQVTAWESTETRCVIPNSLQPDDSVSRVISTSSCTLQFKVMDTGVGIAATEQESIFDAFTQAEAGRKSISGTGLGLTISRKLLELMNGSISVESTPGVGSTFTVTVPVVPTGEVKGQAKQLQRTIIGLAPGQPHRRILVVDDQLENRTLMVRLLTHLGLDVQEATNGQDAIALWQQWKPDLTWMDIRMPGIDGYEATRQIRAMEQEQASIIIALTAQASQSDRTLALAAGCNDYISKPFREETLFLKLKEYLGLEYLYADSNPLSYSASMSSPDTNTDDRTPTNANGLAQLPTDWVATLEDLALSCNDRAIVDLVSRLSPEFDPLKMQLLDLATRFEFEQILHLIHRVP